VALAALAAACSAVLVVGLAGAVSTPPSVKAWLGVWKSKKWGYVVFDTAKYNPPQSPQDYVWPTQGTWVYHGLHEFFGAIGPRNGGRANETFGGIWFIEDGTSHTRGSMLIFRKLKKFSGGYWKTCDYYCKSHHPWRGKKIKSCRNGGCKARSFHYTFRQRGIPERSPEYLKYSKSSLSGTIRVFASPEVRSAGAKFLGLEGKATGRGTHVHTEDLGTGIRKVRYGYRAKRGAAYERLRNGTQILYVPIDITSVSAFGQPNCKKGRGVLELTDARSDAKGRAILFFPCGSSELWRFRPPRSGDPASDYLTVKISAK
jgi:hypothetical protein